MPVEIINEALSDVDKKLDTVKDMSLEMTGVTEIAQELLPSEAYVCTSLIEAACSFEPEAEGILSKKS